MLKNNKINQFYKRTSKRQSQPVLSFKTRYTSHEASTNPIEDKQKNVLNKKNIEG